MDWKENWKAITRCKLNYIYVYVHVHTDKSGMRNCSISNFNFVSGFFSMKR